MVPLAFVWLAATAGGLSLLTPCVFPMIPITVSYFTARRSVDRGTAVRGALIFGVGIVTSFTVLGFACALLFGATGVARVAANPWVNLALALIFVAFALALFGAFSVTVPSAWLTAFDRTTRARQGAAVAGPLLMGVTFTLTSFTCTAPFVGTVLVSAAHGAWRTPVIGMLVYSSVFAVPFVALALAPQALGRLPRSGPWLARVKVVMGLAELAAAMKFLANVDLVAHWGVVTRTVVLVSWVALALIAVWVVVHGGLTPVRAALAGACLVLAGWLGAGLAGRPLGELEAFLPPAVEAELSWRINDYAGALAEARRDGRPVFIDFTGYTCTNCRWMEANMFSRSDVKRLLSHFVLARLFTDGDGSIYEQQQSFQEHRFGTVALPLYAIVAPDGSVIATLPGLTRDPVAYVAFLRKGGR